MNVRTSAKFLVLLGALLAMASAARAQLYIATGSTGVTTDFNFTFDTTLNRVTVVVDNTHAGVGGITGTVTSFGFNIPTSLLNTGSLISTSGVPAGGWLYSHPFNLSNFGEDVGAHTGPNNNGGHPPDGVAPGHTATFVFQFGDFGPVDVSDFLGPNGVSLKWQALVSTNPSVNGQSDHAYGNPGTPVQQDLTPVPEPSSYGLMGAASLLAGLGLRRRMLKKARLVDSLPTASV